MNSLIYGFLIIFFFFKQKTAYEMRISDWSSDVCSSDLALARRTPGWPSGMANSMDERTFACQKPNVHGCVEKNTSPLLYPCSLALIRGKSALASQINPLARGVGVDILVAAARQVVQDDRVLRPVARKLAGLGRSEESRVGKEGVRQCSSRG